MKQRGRKAAGSFTVVPTTLPRRLDPPEHLNEVAAGVWRETVAIRPPDYFAGTTALLEFYCVHVMLAQRLSRLIATIDPPTDDQLGKYAKLLRALDRQTSSVMSLSKAMRLAQSARYGARTAARLAEDVPQGRRPWEPPEGDQPA